MRPLLAILLSLTSWFAVGGDPRKGGTAWLSKAAVRTGLRFSGRSEHLLWGRDPLTGRWEALAVLSPPPGSGKGRIVRLHQTAKGGWHIQRVGGVHIDQEMPGRLHAMDAESLMDSGACPPLRPGQDPKVPAAPIEFHFEPDLEDGLPSPAKIFHPHLGLASVVAHVQDDRKDPFPPNSIGATHARGESLTIPLSGFYKGVQVLAHWRGRVWFQLDAQLYAICQEEWRGPWPKVKPRDIRAD